ncbi:MAG TPA: glycosyltransferase family 2 protein [Puia sp.]|nr:glycosyltransferase family 2 protein [Puia sp.]
MQFTCLSIIIPAYNEGQTIDQLLERIEIVRLNRGIEKEVIVVDDCSTDNTAEIVNRFIFSHPSLRFYYLKHDVNLGKGAAIRSGLAMATGEYVIIQDADLEYDPEEYNEMIRPVLRGSADVVFGSRFRGSSAHRALFFWHSIGNKLLTTLSNMLTNLNLTDMETGYKLCKTSLIRGMALKEKGFGFEPEITARLARIPGIRIYEVGISYYGRTYPEGKKINWTDGIRSIYCIFKYNLFR